MSIHTSNSFDGDQNLILKSDPDYHTMSSYAPEPLYISNHSHSNGSQPEDLSVPTVTSPVACASNPSSTIHYMVTNPNLIEPITDNSNSQDQFSHQMSTDVRVASTPLLNYSDSNATQSSTPGVDMNQVDVAPHSCPSISMSNSASTNCSFSYSPRSLRPLSPEVTPVLPCVICNDRSSGRHYGVMSCEGCKGFFKRTVRRRVEYTCRMDGKCPVDRRQRTRCQACRFKRCIQMGMKREAVQEERVLPNRTPKKAYRPDLCNPPAHSTPITFFHCSSKPILMGTGEPSCSHPLTSQSLPTRTDRTQNCSGPSRVTRFSRRRRRLLSLSLAALLSAELNSDADVSLCDSEDSVYVDINSENDVDPLVHICHSVEQQLPRLFQWAQRLPYFGAPYLSVDDQLWLLRSAWAELLLITAAFNSIVVKEGLLLATGRHLGRAKARQHGLGPLMDRFLSEFVNRFRDLDLERVELALLRAIVLFNPDANNLVCRSHVETVRESLYAALHSYCRHKRPADRTRFSKLMLRLPTLRSFAHKCLEYLVIIKVAAEDPASRRLLNFVDHGAWPLNDPFNMTASTSNTDSPPS